MSSRRVDVPKGWYDNSITGRRERYDGGGNVVESIGQGWIQRRSVPRFGSYPDVPQKETKCES